MKKIDPKIKTEYTLTMQNEIDAINTIADIFFRDVTDDDDTTMIYTPYLERVGQVNAIVRFFLDGVETEEDEDVYGPAMEDKDIRPLIDRFFVSYKENNNTSLTFHQMILKRVMDKVYDLVDYQKALNLARIQNESNSVLTYKLLELMDKEHERNDKELEALANLNTWINEQKKIIDDNIIELQNAFAKEQQSETK